MSFQPYYYVVDRPDFRIERRHWLLGGSLLLVGIGVLLWTVGPIIHYQLLLAPSIGLRTYVSPVPRTAVLGVAGTQSEDSFQDANSWFPAAAADMVELPRVNSYSLSIPKLGIEEANVRIDSDDLSKSLVHWHGTVAPGLHGKSVIFGHSVLPQFFNPENYMAIFSTLHTLDLEDTILVDYDGVQYQYEVVDMFEVQPTEVSVLDQDYSDAYLTLITCTPPGTYLRRLVVQSKLVEFGDEHLEGE